MLIKPDREGAQLSAGLREGPSPSKTPPPEPQSTDAFWNKSRGTSLASLWVSNSIWGGGFILVGDDLNGNWAPGERGLAKCLRGGGRDEWPPPGSFLASSILFLGNHFWIISLILVLTANFLQPPRAL